MNNIGSTDRPAFPPRRASTSAREGAFSAEEATKRSRFGSSPCARSVQKRSDSRSGLWTSAKRPPQRSTRAAAAQTSASVQPTSSRAACRASPAALAPLPAGKYGGLESA